MRFVEVLPDEPATAALLREYFAMREAGFPTPGGYRVVLPDPAVFTPPGGVFLRVDGEEGPVGCGGVRRIAPDERGERMEVKHLYVVPAARGRGAGRALLAALERWAAGAGAASVVLDTNRALEAAGGLYRSAGYASVPPYNDNPNATDWYTKPLR